MTTFFPQDLSTSVSLSPDFQVSAPPSTVNGSAVNLLDSKISIYGPSFPIETVYDGSIGGFQKGYMGQLDRKSDGGVVWSFTRINPLFSDSSYTISVNIAYEVGSAAVDSASFDTLSMNTILLTSESHHVFNEFDKHGLLLGLPRLKDERNPEYKQRLIDTRIHISNSTYMGLIYGITRELGQSLFEAIKIDLITDSNGDFLAPYPSMGIQEGHILLYDDYTTGIPDITIDISTPSSNGYTLQEVVDIINTTTYITAQLSSSNIGSLRSANMFKQNNLIDILNRDISQHGPLINLDHNNIIDGTFALNSQTLTRRVSSQVAIHNSNDFYVDLKAGVIHAASTPSFGDTVRYVAIEKSFVFRASPIIIHDVQDNNFRSKMFEKISTTGEAEGLPTKFGADIINQLMSLYPSGWGR